MEYCVRYVDFPITIRGVTIMDIDGFCNIYINARLSPDAQRRALEHELTHINRDDFYSDAPLEAIETM